MQYYETPFILGLNKPVIFPDFTIEYLGEREAEIPEFIHRFFTFRDYKITTESEEKTISWSSGTGLLAPLKFTISDKTFSFQPWGIDFTHEEISIKQL